MRKAFIIFFSSFFVLVLTLSWEHFFDKHDQKAWVERFQKRLNHKEEKADEFLYKLKDTVDFKTYSEDEDIIYLIFTKEEDSSKVVFWTNAIIGTDELYDKIDTDRDFTKLGNTYYVVRRRENKENGDEYVALIRIKESYPYNNKYIKDRFGKFLKISSENIDNIIVSPFQAEAEWGIKNKEGKTIFYIEHSEDYKDRSINIIFLSIYFLCFLSFFYVYDLILMNTSSIRKQLYYIIGFLLFVIALHFIMFFNRIPDSLYRLSIFDPIPNFSGIFWSIGDFLISAFSICQIIYITFANLKINYNNPRLIRYRYINLIFCVAISLLYVCILNKSISLLIYRTDAYLNMARVIDIGIPSILAFVTIVLGGIGIVTFIDGSIKILRRFFSLPTFLAISVGIILVFIFLMYLQNNFLQIKGGIFVGLMFIVCTLNRYLLRPEVQRTMFLLIMLLLSVYIVKISQKFEKDRELNQRLEYGTELIEERDYNFEKKLLEINNQIYDTEVIPQFVAEYNEDYVRECFSPEAQVMDMTGYNYMINVILCTNSDSLFVEPENHLYGCNEYFRELIKRDGIKIENTNFYAINSFDGLISYVGEFTFGEVTLYLRFDSSNDSEGKGYPEILSRKSVEGRNTVYSYSYGKYNNKKLVYSSGYFNYYKTLDRLGTAPKVIEVVNKDDYSHMLIPVNDYDVLIISLNSGVFSLYYLNILYAFFVCILFSSYGLFFGNTQGDYKKDTLKKRIKNSFLSLVFILFVILAFLYTSLTIKSFESKHYAKAIELLKYINKELEQLECVEAQQCHYIEEILTEWSEILEIDINIYSDRGRLVATSRPEIFDAKISGYLVDYQAFDKIIKEQAMSYVNQGRIGELEYMGAYMPLELENGNLYILNVPYFTQNDELNLDIIIMVIILINIAVVVMVLAFLLSGIVAERVTKPIQLINDKLKQMHIGGKNEKIMYAYADEIGALVKEYNNMVEKLEDSVVQLAKSERETAWREMARQIAHEIKNPLTPMKLNIQFMQRSLQINHPEEFKERFKDISQVLIEQIDNMASIASAFSDFAQMPVSQMESFDISEMALNNIKFFYKNVDKLEYDIEPHIYVFADKEQIQRVFVNILKNAVQSIPEDREGRIFVKVKRSFNKVIISIKDNGTGIPEELRDKIFQPNFTTKSSGMGLGLAITHRTIESMGGTIDFLSSSAGTEFIFTLICEAKK